MLRAWVLAVAVPRFNSMFQVADEHEMQNHCTPNLKRSENTQPPPIHPTLEAGGVLVKGSSWLQTKAAGTTTTSGQFLVKWNKAISAKVELLPTTEHNNYQKMITAKAKVQESPPPKEEILGAQAKLCEKIAGLLHGCLGWDQKQVGDALCFLSIIYHDRYNEIQEDHFMVSNKDEFISDYDQFISLYNTCMSVEMASTTKDMHSHPVDNNPEPGHIPPRWGKKQYKCKAPAVVEQSCHSSCISKPPSKIITPTKHTGQELPKKTCVSDRWCWDTPTDAASGTIPGTRKCPPPPTMNNNCPCKKKHRE
ncbi:hypothetical protein P691DRAFT_764741 [Macrolepiota fuliginosa MF-IS2]|uniref:Uncharacterized protein n=1 Tax=Macrolepiota fuliginosa MF-IS2 TaxID=1400762 RepID=A0A9P6BWI6_9AGAR|nr:hypothetical protein P691DRAFT_764741 [Macrolepiota fuliginosa MF-IS2]